MSQERAVKKDQLILYQGEVPSVVFLVKSGLVRSLNVGTNGEERTIALFGPGDYFPVGYIFDKSPVAFFYYQAASDSVLQTFDKASFQKQLYESKSTDELSRLSVQYVSAMLQINALGQIRARDRIIRIMQFLCLRFGEPTAGGVYINITIPLTQLDISRLAGLTRESAAIELGLLKSQEIIKVKKKIYSVHLKKLLTQMDDEDLSSVVL